MEGVSFYCALKVMRNLLGQGQIHFMGILACEAQENELLFIIRMAKIATGRALFVSIRCI